MSSTTITASLKPYIDINNDRKAICEIEMEAAEQSPEYKKLDAKINAWTIAIMATMVIEFVNIVVLNDEPGFCISCILIICVFCIGIRMCTIACDQKEITRAVQHKPSNQSLPLSDYIRNKLHIDIMSFRYTKDRLTYEDYRWGRLPEKTIRMECVYHPENDNANYYGVMTINPDAKTVAFTSIDTMH